ncbi:MAG: phosphocholine cytidylyltransferase family protein [Bacteroidia bacterium]|nr:phosphocholine cytidylyltransferase family protein [Bacteroidia bacterium]
MQAIIMAAGFGSRIAKITNNNPKSFLEINNEKLIHRAIRLLKERDINDITVVTGYKRDVMQKVLTADIKTKFNPLYYCTNVLASFAIGMGNLEDDFIFLHADTIFDEKILDDLLESESLVSLPVDYKSCVEEEMKVTTADGVLVEISKQIPLNEAEGEFIGLAKIKSEIIARLKEVVVEELKDKKNLNDYFEAAIQNMVNQGVEVACVPTNGLPWIEIDFPEDYETAKELFSSNNKNLFL